jgi:hypothetical protein
MLDVLGWVKKRMSCRKTACAQPPQRQLQASVEPSFHQDPRP